ncbi:MAG: hypothetical protein JWM80_2370 [Cyanobacteria bacterium RYN_339]|nr:hypothetical protein [Cyanobacteria bacterium RYN_339]
MTIDWQAHERELANGIVLDRPRLSRHPHYPEIVYPIDYGYVQGTVGLDGEALDVFVGTATTGLVGACFTTDKRKGDQELKLLWNCSPAEVYLVHGFLNFAPEHMTSVLHLRRPLAELWDAYMA